MNSTKKERAAAERKRQETIRAQSRRGRVKLAEMPWDMGATGPANRAGLVEEERGEKHPKTGKVIQGTEAKGVRRVDLLDFWQRRGSISEAGALAGKTLRAAYEHTMRSPPALPDNDRVQVSPKPDHAISIQMERMSRFAKLMGKVAREDRDIIRVCVLDGGHPARVYGATRSAHGFKHLRSALERLSDALNG